MRILKIILVGLVLTSSYSQNVTYDTTFGTNGVASYCLTGDPHGTKNCVLQSNGKIINLSLDYWGCFELIRFNTDGSLDTTFGTNGYVGGMCSQFSTGGFLSQDIIIQADDKILIIGNEHTSNPHPTYWVTRLLPDGALDISFNGTGYIDLNLGSVQDRGTCIALQPDGKILLGGSSGSVGQYFTMIRLNENGTFDTTFGTNGVVQTLFPNSPQSWGTCIAVQPDGKLVMGGYAQTGSASPFEFAVARYMPNGTLDTTFGTGGMLTTDIVPNASDQITDIVLQPDGKIIAIGLGDTANTTIMKGVRYLSNGNLDTAFANNGIVSFSNSYSYLPSVALQTDGKIIVTGGQDTCSIYRVNNNGSLDNTLVTNDYLMPLSNCISNTAVKVLLQPNGKILIGGGDIIQQLLHIDTAHLCCVLTRASLV